VASQRLRAENGQEFQLSQREPDLWGLEWVCGVIR
jgi:hypothetical protein